MAMASSRKKLTSGVLLGFVDERITEKHRQSVDFTTNKIGGIPNWQTSTVSEEDLKCSGCRSDLSFICQIYAPLENSSDHRSLYLFACLQRRCWNSQHGWKCFRSQRRDPVYGTSSSKKISTASTDWVGDADDWDDDNEDENGNNLLEQMETLNVGEEEDDEEEDQSGSSNDNNANDLSYGASGGGSISQVAVATAEIESETEVEHGVVAIDTPEELLENTKIPLFFYGRQKSSSSSEVVSKGGIFVPYFLAVEEEFEDSTPIITDHERKLLLEFKAKEQLESRSMNSSTTDSTDGYEKAVPLHGDVVFHKFITVIQKNPGQVLRYSRNPGHIPLFVTKPIGKLPDNCRYCNGPLIFEFQVLPSLLSFLKLEFNETSSQSFCMDDDEPLEFGTVLVFTCQRSCWNFGESQIRQEQVFIQAEPLRI